MTYYKVTLEHNSGFVTVNTWASNWQQAVEQVLNSECAPWSALVSVGDYA